MIPSPAPGTSVTCIVYAMPLESQIVYISVKSSHQANGPSTTKPSERKKDGK